jgi:hypothetical protein
MIPLTGGPAVPESIVLWLLSAEDRGLIFRVLPDGRLHVAPARHVRDDDDRFIREHRDVLKACVGYIERQCEVPL